MTPQMPQPDEGIVKTVKLRDLAPEGWFTDPAKSSLWFSGYRALRVPNEYLKTIELVDLQHVRVIFVRGTINYLDASASKIEIISETQWTFDADKIVHKSAPEGTYVLIIAPYVVDGTPGIEAATRDHVRDAVGLLATLYGRNVVYQHLFDNLVELAEEKRSVFSPTTENPLWFPAVNLSTDGIALLNVTSMAISQLPERDRNRTYLALRWLQYALYDMDGTSSFIKYWVAIETLAMPDTSNVRPINEALAKTYGMTVAAANQHFLVGRIFNLRSRIVHDGRIVPVHAQLLRYLESLFADLLAIMLGLQCEKRTETVLADPSCDLTTHLQIA
jgi:hypothetical protein